MMQRLESRPASPFRSRLCSTRSIACVRPHSSIWSGCGRTTASRRKAMSSTPSPTRPVRARCVAFVVSWRCRLRRGGSTFPVSPTWSSFWSAMMARRPFPSSTSAASRSSIEPTRFNCARRRCASKTGRPVPEGALFYAETKRRVVVAFDDELRLITETTATQLVEVFRTERTPAPTHLTQRCCACSLKVLCRPGAVVKSAAAWRRRMCASVLADEP